MNNTNSTDFDQVCQNLWQDLEKTIRYLNTEEISLVRKSYLIAIELFQDDRRNNNQYYLEHKVNVAKILAGIKLDKVTIISALLYGDLAEGKLEKEKYYRQKCILLLKILTK